VPPLSGIATTTKNKQQQSDKQPQRKKMPRLCPESPRSPPWIYAVVVLGFVVAVVLYGGLMLAQKRVFPSEARLYGTPVPPHIVRGSSSDLAWNA
jgi:hypothetical protein